MISSPRVPSLDINYRESNEYPLTGNKFDRNYLTVFPTPRAVCGWKFNIYKPLTAFITEMRLRRVV